MNMRHTFRRWVLFVLVWALAWVYLFLPNYQKYHRMHTINTKLKTEIGELEAKVAHMQKRVNALKHDPVVIEHEIRQNLRWIGPNEVPAHYDAAQNVNHGDLR